jgi:hypothetical protein
MSAMPTFPDPGAKKGKTKKTVPRKNTQKKQEKQKVPSGLLEDIPIGLRFHRLGEREGEPKIFKVSSSFILLLVCE